MRLRLERNNANSTAVILGITTNSFLSISIADFRIIDTEQVNIGDSQDAGNGTVLATDPITGSIWIAYWEEGVEFYNGASQTTGGPRLWFGGGTTNNDPKGGESFTEDGETAFVNAVNFMLGNSVSEGLRIESIEYDKANDSFTLTWNSKDSATYGIFYSEDLIDFDADVEDTYPSQGETTSFTFANRFPGTDKLFFRVIEN